MIYHHFDILRGNRKDVEHIKRNNQKGVNNNEATFGTPQHPIYEAG